MSKSLKCCPFCGGEVEIYNHASNEFYIACTNSDCNCEAYLPMAITKENAIKDWNIRKPMERIEEELKKVKDETDKEGNVYHYEDEQCHITDKYNECVNRGKYSAFNKALEIVRKVDKE